jgi:hypothetical protein
MRTLLTLANHLTATAVSVWYPKTSLLVSAVAAVNVHAAAPVVLPMAVTVMLMPVAEAVPCRFTVPLISHVFVSVPELALASTTPSNRARTQSRSCCN